MVMFMRYIHITVQNFKAQSVAVVVEISERSNCVKLLDTDSIAKLNHTNSCQCPKVVYAFYYIRNVVDRSRLLPNSTIQIHPSAPRLYMRFITSET